MITKIINNFTILEPEEGMILSNGHTFSEQVYLGTNDSISNWFEVSVSDYEEIENEIINGEITEFSQSIELSSVEETLKYIL